MERRDCNHSVQYKRERFFCDVPKTFLNTVNVLTDKQRRELNIIETRDYSKQKTGMFDSTPKKWVIVAGDQTSLENMLSRIFSTLSGYAVEERSVIVIDYNKISCSTSFNKHKEYNKENTPKGLEFGFAYAIERKIGAQEPTYEVNGERFTIHHSSRVVLDDTPELRAACEDMYKRIMDLRDRLNDLFKTKEDALRFLSGYNSTNLLGEGPAQIENQ